MKKIKPQYSRKEVKKAGVILISNDKTSEENEWALRVMNNWRACHNYPVNTCGPGLSLAFIEKACRFWLSRRSHKGGISWAKFEKIRANFVLPKPRIVHNI